MTTTVPGASRATRSASTRALLRLEWWRLVRTHRIVALLAVYIFFGATSPPMTRYLGAIVKRLGGDVQVIVPPPRAIDAFVRYVSNANQLALLVFVMVVSSALTVDAQPEMGVFIRTRVRRPSDLVFPRYIVNVAGGVFAFAAGALCTWYGTVLLLGDVDAVGVVVGMAVQGVYLAFVAAVSAAFGSRLHSTLATAVSTIAVALLLALVGVIDTVGSWLPSALLNALSELPAGASAASYAKPVIVTVIVTVLLLASAVGGSNTTSRLGVRR